MTVPKPRGRYLLLVPALLLLGVAGKAQVSSLVSGTVVPRDRTLAPNVGTGSIKGRVIDGQTGAPIARAQVRLMGPGGERPAALTDSSGAFGFTALPRGSYTIVVNKTSYLMGQYPNRGRTLRTASRQAPLGDGEKIDDVTVSLYHGGSIAGRVVDSHGDPVEFANVTALRLPLMTNGQPAVGGSATNDIGEFRISRLDMGSYLVMVVPQRGRPQDDLSTLEPVLTFFPGVPSMDQAEPINLRRGESVTSLEITLSEGALTTLSGTIVDSSGQPVTGGASFYARPILKNVPAGFGGTGAVIKPDGTFELRLAPGEYEIEANGLTNKAIDGPPRPGDRQFGRARLSIGGESMAGVNIMLGHGAIVSGRLVFDGISALPTTTSQLQVTFGAGPSFDSPGCQIGRVELKPDWTFTADGILGTCVARVAGSFGAWNIRAILHNGKDLLDQPIAFDSGQLLRDVEVVLTDKRSELTLRVVDDRGYATEEYAALVYPTDKARWYPGSRYVRTYVPPQDFPASSESVGPAEQSGSAMASSAMPGMSSVGADRIFALPPGEYYVIAVDDISSDQAREQAIFERLAPAAQRITIPDGGKVEASLRRLKLP